jgi:hypothetical protein
VINPYAFASLNAFASTPRQQSSGSANGPIDVKRT